MKHGGAKKKDLLLRPDQHVIGFADSFQFRFQFLIIIQPALNLVLHLGANTELLGNPTGVPNREDPGGVSFAARALGATLLMANCAMQKRTAKDLGQRRKVGREFLTDPYSRLMFHQSQ
jgi:hypothetical protein